MPNRPGRSSAWPLSQAACQGARERMARRRSPSVGAQRPAGSPQARTIANAISLARSKAGRSRPSSPAGAKIGWAARPLPRKPGRDPVGARGKAGNADSDPQRLVPRHRRAPRLEVGPQQPDHRLPLVPAPERSDPRGPPLRRGIHPGWRCDTYVRVQAAPAKPGPVDQGHEARQAPPAPGACLGSAYAACG